MEWCLLFPTSQQGDLTSMKPAIPAIGEPCWQGGLPEAMALLEDNLGEVSFSRVYFGCEFCQRLIPTKRELQHMITIAREKDISFSLVTPYVTDEGLEKLSELFDFLSIEWPGCEIVVNDWGVLRLLSREYTSLTPVLGRLMNKMMRAPRVAQFYDVPHAPSHALRVLQQSSLTAPHYRRFLQDMGVNRVELDWLVQGIALDFNTLGVKASIYVPFAFVATGRVCMTGSIHLPETKKFTPGSPCHRECRWLGFQIVNANPHYDPDQVLYQFGNSVFYLHDAASLIRLATYVQSHGVDRLVYQFRPL